LPEILVRRDQHLIAVEDGHREDVAVAEAIPTLLEHGVDFVVLEKTTQRNRRSLVEENLHAEAWSSRLAAANSSTASTCSRVTPGNHSTN